MSTTNITTMAGGPGNSLCTVDQLMRDRGAIYQRITEGTDLRSLAIAMIATVIAGAGIFGAAIGAYRGGIQIVYAAIKLPAVMILTAAICAPCLTTLNSALGRPACIRRDLALLLSALALASLVIAAAAPLALLGVTLGMGYHQMALVLFSCCAISGLSGLALLWRGLGVRSPRARFTSTGVLLVVFAMVGAQMAWTLRPYLLRPRTQEVPFIRAVEGTLLESVKTTVESARGDYSREYAPLPEGGE